MVKHIFDRYFLFSKPPEIRTVEGLSAIFDFRWCKHRLCSQTTRATNCATPGCIILFYIATLIDFLLSIRGASLRNIVAALRPTEGQTPQKPFKFTRDILPFLARFVNLKAMRLRSFRQVLRFIPLKMLFVPFLIFFLISVL